MAQKKAKISLPPSFTDTIHSDSDLSPLTPLSMDLEESPIMIPMQSDPYWCRYAEKGFQLPWESEIQAGPQCPGIVHAMFTTRQRTNACITEPKPIIGAERLADGVKKLINSISTDIIRTWPPYPGDKDKSMNVLLLVNAYAFITQAFNPKLQPMVNEASNLQQQVRKCQLVHIVQYLMGI